MSFTYIRRAAVALVLLATAGCTVKSTETPPLTGPSGLALSLNVNAIPDSISQDGGSQSSVKVTAIGPNGKPIASLPLRLDMFVNGAPQDYGTLSARSVITNSEGIATAVYTAPPGPVNGLFGTCSGLPGNCVAIVATPTGSDFTASNPEQVLIRLMPTGVILPPAANPTARFTISPTPVNFNVASIFDASTSSVGSGASVITSYAWTFGDGSSGSGKTVSHTFTQSTSPGNAYNVTLTVTNDRGLSNSTTQAVSVDASPSPAGDWVFSPTTPVVGDTVFFNADGVKPAAGHQLVQFNWNFGDGGSASGFQATHVFAQGGTYSVVLSVLDDAGQKLVSSKTVLVSGGNPTPTLTVTKTGALTIRADGSVSTGFGGATITNYTFFWGDGTSDSGTASTATHNYASSTGAGTYPVTLRVTDNLGRTATSSPSSVTVP